MPFVVVNLTPESLLDLPPSSPLRPISHCRYILFTTGSVPRASTRVTPNPPSRSPSGAELPAPPSLQWNMGVDQHAQLDRFSLFLPFPYRVAVILLAGMLPPLG